VQTFPNQGSLPGIGFTELEDVASTAIFFLSRTREMLMDELRRTVVIGLPFAIPGLALAKPPDADASAGGVSSLSIDGLVAHKGVLTAQSLRTSALAADVDAIRLTTQSGELKRTLTGYRGIKLMDLLDQAQIEAPDHNSLKRTYVIVRASDGYMVIFSWSELYNTEIGPGVLVLVEKDGQPLAQTEGPLTLISRKDIHTGPRHVRWLQSIELRRV
jgi:DMSO/TMAO reductase YedYZ molybdopterin-dependent catalytic subunit